MNEIERKHVHDAYQTIATDFSVTRAYLWKSVKEFVHAIEPHSVIVEVGSGNGKNLFRQDCFNLASDLCSEFAKITDTKNIESIVCNGKHLPLRDTCADAVLCIAMLHHITDKRARLRTLQELARTLCPGKQMLVQVWAMTQDSDAKRSFTTQDNYVPFQGRTSKKTVSRFYHIFKKGELDALFDHIDDVRIDQSFWEKGNWIVIATKL